MSTPGNEPFIIVLTSGTGSPIYIPNPDHIILYEPGPARGRTTVYMVDGVTRNVQETPEQISDVIVAWWEAQ